MVLIFPDQQIAGMMAIFFLFRSFFSVFMCVVLDALYPNIYYAWK